LSPRSSSPAGWWRRVASPDTNPVAALPPLRDIIARHGLAADKRFGQHFLLDLNLTAKIAREAGPLGSGTTIEIGPGPGGLTRALLLAGATQVIAIERDARCLALLGELEQAAAGRLSVLSGDALEIDAATLGTAPRRIVANLPYNVATPLLIAWLRDIGAFESLTLMFQKEVADRLAAAAGSAAYGRLSVVAQRQCHVKILFDLPARAFTTPPKVASSVVRFTPRADALDATALADLEAVTAAAFGQRRKMLRASLKSLGTEVAPLLEQAGLAGTARAEEIDDAGFDRLAGAWRAARAQ
jgi:16S rRNA (adenine1518-N6/adenine1519-N6)-dimethyltransferase